jgi:hypothetical protein
MVIGLTATTTLKIKAAKLHSKVCSRRVSFDRQQAYKDIKRNTK